MNGKFSDIMELCFYNAVMTGMSTSGEQFTYVNQLASSDTDLSKRAEWFTCACCPPNVTRLLGYIGGYLWTSTVDEEQNKVQVNVHLYSSAILKVQTEKGTIELEQKSNWPWEGDVEFSLKCPEDVATTIKLRIPEWAVDWEVRPLRSRYHKNADFSKMTPNPTAKIENGYLVLPSEWLKTNSKFKLSIPMKIRFVSPHPYTNQNVIAVARGPLIYCVEDFDNSWVEDHFKVLKMFAVRNVIG